MGPFTLECQPAPGGILIRSPELPGWAVRVIPGDPSAGLLRQVITEMEIVAYAHQHRAEYDLDPQDDLESLRKAHNYADRRARVRAGAVQGSCGQRSGYVGGCRCSGCTLANRAYEANRRRSQLRLAQ